MKKNLLFPGLCVALGLGIACSANSATSKALYFCCDQMLIRCSMTNDRAVYGPRVPDYTLCYDFRSPHFTTKKQ